MIFKMKKMLNALWLAPLLMSLNTQAADKNIEAKLPQQCQKLFSATEKLVIEAKNQPGTHTQINKIQNKLNQSKKQILEMELATQVKTCDQGLAKLTGLHKEEKEQLN